MKNLFLKDENAEAGKVVLKADKIVDDLLAAQKIKASDYSVSLIYARQIINDWDIMHPGTFDILTESKVKDAVLKKYGVNSSNYGFSGYGASW